MSRLAALLLLWLLTLPLPLAAAVIEGRVVGDHGPLAGVTVQAFAGLDFATTALATAAPSQADGRFRLEVPPGSYALFAWSADRSHFAFCGRNPVTVGDSATPVWAGLQAVPVAAATRGGYADPYSAAIEGQVLHGGKPVANASVFVYPDLSAQFKGFGLGMSAPTDVQGLFEVPLPAGSYYLVARVRHGGSLVGPLQAGDLFGYLPANPVTVGDGEVVKVALPVIAVPEKVSRHAATMFGQTRISGLVVDRAGKPLAGLQALLYADDAMLNRPLYVSQPTGADGVFQLSFPTGGTFYLAARNTLGGTPAPGELYGRYQGSGGAALKVETGQNLEGLQIVVEEVW